MKELLLAEHENQVKDFLRRGLKGEWIALGPSAMWALEKQGINYKIPEDFYSPEELERICINSHHRVESLCKLLDEEMFKQNPELREWGIKPFQFNIFPLTILFDGIVGRLFILRSIFKKYPDYKIWVHKNSAFQPGFFGLTFSNELTLWGQLLSIPGWNKEISFLPGKGKALSFSKMVANLWNRGKSIIKRFKSYLKAATRIISRDKSRNFLLYGDTGEWKYVLPLLLKSNDKVIPLNGENFGPDISGGKSKFSKMVIEASPDFFTYEGLYFYPLLESRLNWIKSNTPLIATAIIRELQSLIRQFNPKAILVSNCADFISHCANQIVKYFRLPVINWQHGFVFKDKIISQLNEFNDLMTSDVLFVFGPKVEKAYQDYLDKFQTKVVTIGAPSLDALKNNEGRIPHDSKKWRVLYVTTNYYQNIWYGGFYPPFSDRLFYQDQMTIMEGLKEIERTTDLVEGIIVKLHPAGIFDDPPWLQDFRGNLKFKFIRKSPTFSELLGESDAIIIDAPTTTLLQALTTRRPLFVLTRHIKYPTYAQEMLDKRAVCSDSAATLMRKLNEFLKTDSYPANLLDREFIRAYGTNLDDRKSAERTVKVLENMMAGRI